jgi:hypothetical protein
LFYALFLILGHGSHAAANTQNNILNTYDGRGMKDGVKMAGCDFGAIADKLNFQSAREALNSY